jgi:arylsulfatase A-like enzyme
VVVFFSDNGGLSTAEGAPTSNRPLRGGKGWVYEGGIREPLLVRYPGVTAPGSVCHTPVCSIDMLPTLLDIAQLPLPAGREIDGVSLLPLLRGQSIVDRPLYWHYPHYGNQGGFPGGAIRQGDFKLIERYEDGRVQLYNLKEDIGEQNDLARQQPRRARQMRQKLHAWYQTVDAKFLRPREPWTPNESPASGKGSD